MEGPRISDIAEAAGVSITTVSHALNGKGRVLPETRDRIARVAAELGYVANVHAQRLASGRHMTLAIQVSSEGRATLAYDSAYYVRVLNAASAAAFERGYTPVLAPSDIDAHAIERLAVDGALIVDPTGSEPLMEAVRARGAAVVTVGRVLRDGAGAWVDNDHARLTEEILDHFRDAGYRRPALVTGATNRSYAADAVRAYEAWTARAGAPSTVVTLEEPPTAGLGFAAAQRLLRRDEPPDAVFATFDVVALGTLQAARACGLRVPDDLAIASAVDGEALELSAPPLTAFDLQPERLAREAVLLLADLLAGRAADVGGVLVPADLRTRASTRGIPASAP
jgi:DNA-binding LacI/PurR family transcriptional regulator